ncbi:MAG: flagellar protein FlaG, partial [Burkholderiaceae bacterium]|nr:flagellar protein FlaG [Burkholderiaceae bacterium]
PGDPRREAAARPVQARAQAVAVGASAVAARQQPLAAAVAEANRELARRGSELTFEVDDDSGRLIVKLIDKRTGAVLRQIPSQEMLQIARTLLQGRDGALVRTDV